MLPTGRFVAKKNEENTISSFISWLQQLHTSEENCISILQETQEVPTIQLPFLVFLKLFFIQRIIPCTS